MADIEKLIQQAAQRYHINARIFRAQLNQESGLNPNAVSPAGARGIAQFMPGTAKGYGVNLNDGRVSDDIDGAARYMRDNLKQFGGDYRKALAAYNAGAGAVQKYGGVPPFQETQNYVKTILSAAGQSSNPRLGSKSTASGGSDPTITQTSKVTPGVSHQGERAAAAAQWLMNRHKPGATLGLASALADIPADTADTVSRGATITPGTGTVSASFKTPKGKGGVVKDPSGRQVAAWIEPALQYARAHGWKGTVASGYRTFEDQTRIYNSGVRPAAKPGTSNHEGADYPRGAVDVTDAQALAQILAKSPYGKRLKWAGAKDPVHFSHPHNGSY